MRFSQIKFHLLFWILLIGYEIGVIYSYTFKLSHPLDYLGHYFLNISLFYFHAQVVLRGFLTDPARKMMVIVLVPAELIVYLGLKYLMISSLLAFGIPLADPFEPFRLFITEGIWRSVYFIGLSSAYWFFLSSMNYQREILNLQKQEVDTRLQSQVLENAYLQSQINPHFLFNTLTFLYTSANRLSEKLSESILLLSDVMRYSLKGPGPDGKTSLEEEIEQIQNFLTLNQARFDDKLAIEFIVNGSPENLRIIPLALLTFVENMVKYGDLKDASCPGKIYLTIANKAIALYISNKVNPGVATRSGHGIGIDNVKRRLEMYYPGQYILNIDHNESHYHLNLGVTL